MGLPPKPRLAPCLNPKGVRTPKRAADEAAPMLRQLRTKFIALNMTLAALVLAASFATICYADYRADIDDVRNRLMAATSRSLHEPQLIPDAEPFHRGEAPREDGENAADADGTDDDDNRAGNEAAGGTDADNDAEGATSGNANPGKSVEGAETPAEDGSAPAPTQDIGAGTSDPGFAPPRIGGPGTAEEASLPVAVYYIADRTVMQLTDRSGATVPEALLVHAIPEVVSAEAPWGYLPDVGLYFAKHEAGPDLMVAFADGSAADGWRSLALVLTAVGLGALGLLFLLNLVFSRWALRPVQQAWAQQQQFIADATHELKTPLTVILANNAILRQRGSDTIASQRQWIESTQMEAERMQSLVTDMLDLARPTPQGAQTSEGPAAVVDLSRLVEGEALTFEAVAFERDLTWQCTVAPGIAVRGNAARLQRAVAVLLDNACKYTDPGGTVAVTLRAATGDAVLSVRNSGEPIDAADLPHLFDRFYRADKARTHNAVDSENDGAGGYGLGLAIARDIAQAHKGARRHQHRTRRHHLHSALALGIKRPRRREEDRGAGGLGQIEVAWLPGRMPGQSGDATSPALRRSLKFAARRSRRRRAGFGETPWKDGSLTARRLPARRAPAIGAAPLPFEDVSVEVEAEGVEDLVWVVGKAHGARRHDVTVAAAVGEPAYRHGIEQRDGAGRAHVPTAAALHAVARGVGNA